MVIHEHRNMRESYLHGDSGFSQVTTSALPSHDSPSICTPMIPMKINCHTYKRVRRVHKQNHGFSISYHNNTHTKLSNPWTHKTRPSTHLHSLYRLGRIYTLNLHRKEDSSSLEKSILPPIPLLF